MASCSPSRRGWLETALAEISRRGHLPDLGDCQDPAGCAGFLGFGRRPYLEGDGGFPVAQVVVVADGQPGGAVGVGDGRRYGAATWVYLPPTISARSAAKTRSTTPPAPTATKSTRRGPPHRGPDRPARQGHHTPARRRRRTPTPPPAHDLDRHRPALPDPPPGLRHGSVSGRGIDSAAFAVLTLDQINRKVSY